MKDAKKLCAFLILMGVMAIAILASFLYGRKVGRNGQEEVIETKVDSTSTIDTSTFIEPEEEPAPKVITKEIPVPVYVTDSTMVDSLLNECARLERRGDSLQLILLREQRHYSDTTYDAWISGIDPRLDSIKTYNSTKVITIETVKTIKEKSRWGLGIQAGAGISTQGIVPYVGVGVNYNILSW